MELTVDNTSKAGKPVRIFDADGVEITHVIWCDTETGAVTRFETADGKIVLAFGVPKRIIEFRPAPLQVEIIDMPDFKKKTSMKLTD